MSKMSKNRSSGISALEIVFGITILIMLVIFTTLILGRRGKEATPSLTRERGVPGPARALPDRELYFDEGAAVDAMADDDLSESPQDAGWNGSDEPGLLQTPQRSSAEPRRVAGESLRDYFSSALAVAGRPDWRSFLSLARQLELEQYPAVWDLLQAQPWSREKQEAMEAFMASWAGQDPEAAIDFALGLQSSRQRHTAYGAALEAWGAQDPDAALAWYEQQNEAGTSGRMAGYHLLKGIYASDPGKALEMVWQMEDAHRQASSLRSLFLFSRETREQGAMELKTLFDASEDPEHRQVLGKMVAGVWAVEDPMRAIAWGAELADEPDLQKSIYMTAAQAWGRREPEAAMMWLEEQELVQSDSGVIAGITRSWARDNPDSLQQWIEAAPPSTTRDVAVSAQVERLRNHDPAAALALAESISVADDRYRTMASVADRWMRINRGAAASAVLSSTMPAEMKRKYAMKVIPRKQ